MEDYFNYFTEIEEHYQRRRGTLTLLSPLDWALMEIWKDAGISLAAVLRGIDVTFEKWERRPKRTRKINSLAFCAQEVLGAAEEMQESAVGAHPKREAVPGLDKTMVGEFLRQNAEKLERAPVPETAKKVAAEMTTSLRDVAAALESTTAPSMEDVERRLTVMEEKLIAALLASTPEADLLKVHTEADRDLAPYRSRMTAPQIDQLHKQYIQKRLLEQYQLPRLSLFYMQ